MYKHFFAVIPSGLVGSIVGTLLILCLKSDTKKVAVIPWAATILILPALFGLFISCPTLPISGITFFSNRYDWCIYMTSALSIFFPIISCSSDVMPSDTTISSCNYDCACNSSAYEPVCGADGITYFSPCRAGCKKTFDNNTGVRTHNYSW